jgi:hypothetical protein
MRKITYEMQGKGTPNFHLPNRQRPRSISLIIVELGTVHPALNSKVSPNSNDFYACMLQGSIYMKKIIKLDWNTELTPVDFVAKAIANVSMRYMPFFCIECDSYVSSNHDRGLTLHLVNPGGYSPQLLHSKLKQVCNVDADLMEPSKWLEYIQKQTDTDNPILKVLKATINIELNVTIFNLNRSRISYCNIHGTNMLGQPLM